MFEIFGKITSIFEEGGLLTLSTLYGPVDVYIGTVIKGFIDRSEIDYEEPVYVSGQIHSIGEGKIKLIAQKLMLLNQFSKSDVKSSIPYLVDREVGLITISKGEKDE